MSLFNKDKDLLRQIIISHYDKPNNKVEDDFNGEQYLKFHNKSASCIDDITVYLKVDGDIIKDAKFSGIGCAISTASTDILCDNLISKNIKEATNLLNNYLSMIKNEEYDEQEMNELIAFFEIYKQQNRVKCSLIGYDAINKILKENGNS